MPLAWALGAGAALTTLVALMSFVLLRAPESIDPAKGADADRIGIQHSPPARENPPVTGKVVGPSEPAPAEATRPPESTASSPPTAPGVDPSPRESSPEPLSTRGPPDPEGRPSGTLVGKPYGGSSVGSLNLNSEPWTEVYLETQKLGVTPLTSLRLRPGSYRLRLVNWSRGIDATVEVSIQPGKTTTLMKRF